MRNKMVVCMVSIQSPSSFFLVQKSWPENGAVLGNIEMEWGSVEVNIIRNRNKPAKRTNIGGWTRLCHVVTGPHVVQPCSYVRSIVCLKSHHVSLLISTCSPSRCTCWWEVFIYRNVWCCLFVLDFVELVLQYYWWHIIEKCIQINFNHKFDIKSYVMVCEIILILV